MFAALAGLAASIVLFHVGAAKSMVNLLLKNGRFKSRGTNAFTLRQLSGKLSANAVMAGALAFLLAFAVIGANVSFVQKVGNEASLKKIIPSISERSWTQEKNLRFPLKRRKRLSQNTPK